MLIGVNVTDTFLLANHHKVINISNSTIGKQKISIRRFAGILSNQLFAHARRLSASSSQFLPDSPLDIILIVSNKDSSKSSVSDLSSELFTLSEKQAVRSLQDANGKTHYLVKFDITKDPSGHSRCKKRKCKLCYERGKSRDVSYYCISCGEGFSFCNKGDGHDCFKTHVEQIRRITRHSRNLH
jgi:hypothetical protein